MTDDVQFNIVDGDYIPYDEIKRDYMDERLKSTDIIEKYGLNTGMWKRLLRDFRRDGVPMRKRIM